MDEDSSTKQKTWQVYSFGLHRQQGLEYIIMTKMSVVSGANLFLFYIGKEGTKMTVPQETRI